MTDGALTTTADLIAEAEAVLYGAARSSKIRASDVISALTKLAQALRQEINSSNVSGTFTIGPALSTEGLPQRGGPLRSNLDPADGDVNFDPDLEVLEIYSASTGSWEVMHIFQGNQAYDQINGLKVELAAAQEAVNQSLEALYVAIAAASEVAAQAAELAEAALPKTGGRVTGDLSVTGVLTVGGTPIKTGTGNALAIGLFAQEAGAGLSAVALGRGAQRYASAKNSTALGPHAQMSASAEGSLAIGSYAQANASGLNSLAIGTRAHWFASGENAIAIGNESGHALGNSIATSTTNHDLAAAPLEADWHYYVAGKDVVISRSDADPTTLSGSTYVKATGTETSITATSGLQIRPVPRNGKDAITLGRNAVATVDDGIAIGRGVTTDDAKVVCIGKPGIAERLKIGAYEMVSAPELKALIASANDFEDLKTKAASNWP